MTKKQNYIYVARDDTYGNNHDFDSSKMKKIKGIFRGFIFRTQDGLGLNLSPIESIKLKKGEQKRIPILIEKAEVV